MALGKPDPRGGFPPVPGSPGPLPAVVHVRPLLPLLAQTRVSDRPMVRQASVAGLGVDRSGAGRRGAPGGTALALEGPEGGCFSPVGCSGSLAARANRGAARSGLCPGRKISWSGNVLRARHSIQTRL